MLKWFCFDKILLNVSHLLLVFMNEFSNVIIFFCCCFAKVWVYNGWCWYFDMSYIKILAKVSLFYYFHTYIFYVMSNRCVAFKRTMSLYVSVGVLLQKGFIFFYIFLVNKLLLTLYCINAYMYFVIFFSFSYLYFIIVLYTFNIVVRFFKG